VSEPISKLRKIIGICLIVVGGLTFAAGMLRLPARASVTDGTFIWSTERALGFILMYVGAQIGFEAFSRSKPPEPPKAGDGTT
jgi:hypothetical protein